MPIKSASKRLDHERDNEMVSLNSYPVNKEYIKQEEQLSSS